MTDDSNLPGEEPPIPPIAGGGADPTLPGGADPTIAQPAQPAEPHYTTGPGVPPERDPGAAVPLAGGVGGGSAAAAGGPPPWLIPAAVGVIAGLVVAILAVVVLSGDDGDDSIASDSSTIPPVTTVVEGTETTVPVVAETTVPAASDTTVPDATATTTPEPTESTVPDATATTVASGGDGSSDEPCADGYAEVTALPFGICSQGEVVRNAQFSIALFAPIDVDGFYGPSSFTAVMDLQRNLGLEPDGIVTQDLLDLLEGEVPESEFVVASPGTVRIFDTEYPIELTCRTIPFEGRTADYQVISYVFRDEFGTQVLDRWTDEGGVTGAYFGEGAPVTELSQGFGFEVPEGDTLLQVSVNPVDPPRDTCVGRVLEFDASGEPTRVYSIVDGCAADGGRRFALSENARFSYEEDGAGGFVARFDAGIGGDFFFGDGTDVGLVTDGAVQVVTVPIESGGSVRQLQAEFAAVDFPSC